MSEPQHIGTAVVIINNAGQILLGKRKNAYKSGYWGVPGGRIELGETTENTGKREVLEETGIVLSSLDYLGVIREGQGEYDFIHFAFTATIGDQHPRNQEPEKCEGWEWFDMNTLPSPLLPAHLEMIHLLKERKQTLVDLNVE